MSIIFSINSKLSKSLLFILLKILLLKFSLAQQLTDSAEYRIPLENALGGSYLDYVSELQYIPLDDKEVVFSKINSVLTKENIIFIADENNLVAFDASGNAKWKIGAYKSSKIVNVKFNFDRSKILIRHSNNQIISADLKGQIMDSKVLAPRLFDSLEINKTTYKFYSPSNKLQYDITSIQDEKEFAIKKQPINKKNDAPPNFSNFKGLVGPFRNGTYLGHYMFWDEIIQINVNQKHKKIKLVFPKENSFKFQESDFASPEALMSFWEQNTKKIFSFSTLALYKDYLIFNSLDAMAVRSTYAYNQENGELINLNSLDVDESNSYLPIIGDFFPPISIDEHDEFIYTLIYSLDISNSRDEIPRKDAKVKGILGTKNPTVVKFKLKD